VIIEERNSQGEQIGRTFVDFIIEISDQVNNDPPEFIDPTPIDSTLVRAADGSNIAFDVSCSDPNGDDVTITGFSLPDGSVFSPNPNTGASPLTAGFSWTPTGPQTTTMTYTCLDSNFGSALPTSIKIEVLPVCGQQQQGQECLPEGTVIGLDAPITNTQCTFDNETSVYLQTGFNFTAGGSCDVFRQGEAEPETHPVTVEVVKDIPGFVLPTIGEAPNTLSINGKHDMPGPVEFLIQAWNATGYEVLNERVTWANDDNSFETKTLVSKLPGDAKTLRFTFENDHYTCDDNGGSDCDRNGEIDFFTIDNKLVEAVNYDELGNERNSDNACIADDEDGNVVCPWEDGYMQYDLDRLRAEPTCYDQTGTFTVEFGGDFGEELGTFTVTEEGQICDVNNDGSELSLSGDVTSAVNSEILPQCGAVYTDIILNNDSTQNSSLSLNQCPVPDPDPEPKKSGGGDNQWDTRPTFGISHEDRQNQVVENGFRFNSEEFMLTDNHHTDFAEQAVEVGTINSFSATVYADKRLKVQEFLFGIPNVGESHLAELGIEVWYDFDGNIEDVMVVQKSEVIDADTISVSHEKTKCLSTDTTPLCDTTTVSMTFLEPLADKVMAIKAIDFKNTDLTYLVTHSTQCNHR
jgi:hypothetical protein